MNRRKTLFLAFSIVLLFGFSSCTSPIAEAGDGDNAARSAKNSEYLSFTIEVDEKMGAVTPSDEMTCRIENTYDISFTENREYQFIRWEVFNSKKGKIVTDVIQIEHPEEPETKITILKYAENIVLRPVCQKRPVISSQIPSFEEEGVYSDSIIVISFDKVISPTSFRYTPEELFLIEADYFLYDEDGLPYGYMQNGELYFKNVKITSSMDENLLNSFYPPVIENGYVVKIMPKFEVPLLTVEGSYLDIDVFLSPEIVDTNYVSIGGEGAQWRYRINSNTDKEPPVINSFALASLFTKLNSQFTDELLVEGEEFSPKNHIKNRVYYSCSGSDNGCGVNYMEVSAQRIMLPDGTPVEEEPVVELVANNHFTKNEDDTSFTTGFIELKNEDGFIELTFIIYDYSGNPSAEVKKYIVAKDTAVDVANLYIYNEHPYSVTEPFTLEDINDKARTICWKNVPDDVWAGTYSTKAEDLKYTLYWGTQKDNLKQKIECSKRENFQSGIWSCSIDSLDSSKETYLRLEVRDALENCATVDAVIPVTPKYFTYQKLSEEGTVTYINPKTGLEEALQYPSHYRIFYSLADVTSGHLYYSYMDSPELKTQQFLNIKYDVIDNSPYLPESKYSDIYVDDISKCKFYFQSVIKGEQVDDSLIVKNESFIPEKTQEQILEELELVFPELKSVYLFLIANEKYEDAELLLNKFNDWNYMNEISLQSKYTSYLTSGTTSFVINEKKSVKAPVVEKITVERGEINSCVNIATVKYTTEPPSDVVFNIIWGTSEDDISNFETEETFAIDSGVTTLFYQTVYVDIFTGDSKISDVCSYDLSEYNFDTIPPKVNALTILNENEYRPEISFDIYYDDFEVKDGLAEYKFYTIPVENSEIAFEQLTEEMIQKAVCLVNSFEPALIQGDFVTRTNKLEVFDFAENYFYLVYVEDASGNFSYYPLKLNKGMLSKTPEIKILQNVDEETLVNIIFNIEKEENCSDYQLVYSFFNENNTTQKFEEIKTVSEKQKSNKEVEVETDKEFVTVSVKDQKDSFMQAFTKAVFKEQKQVVQKNSNPVYVYTGLGENAVCELKDLIEGLDGAQIYCDRPCLVMTYWSSVNYEYSVEDWEKYSVQCNPLYISAKNEKTGEFEDTLQYYKLNYDEIPMGKFFVIIAHFADGTVLMSKKINTN